jgi:hypothetical protein
MRPPPAIGMFFFLFVLPAQKVDFPVQSSAAFSLIIKTLFARRKAAIEPRAQCRLRTAT